MTGTDKKRALVLLADGTEEMEAVITIDVLVRAGVEVTTASTNSNESATQSITCSRGVRIVPDTHLSLLSLPTNSTGFYDVLVIPGGGPGAQTMVHSTLVHQWVQAHYHQPGVWVAAVCAGPTVIKASGVGQGAKVTSHPSVKDGLKDYFVYREESESLSAEGIVVRDEGHGLITSRGPGSTFEFVLAIVGVLKGEETVKAVRGPMMFPQ